MNEFLYTQFGTVAATDEHGRRVLYKNRIRIFQENDEIVFERRYIFKNGEVSQPIKTVCQSDSPLLIAQQIHWGCCGWVANTITLQPLVGLVQEILESF